MTTPTTRAQANEILFLWKVGAEIYPPHVISMALRATGDLGPIELARKERDYQPQQEPRIGPVALWRTSRAGGNSDAILSEAE